MSNSPIWPKRPDGTNQTIGEMSEEDRRRILAEAAARSKLNPEVAALIIEVVARSKTPASSDPATVVAEA